MASSPGSAGLPTISIEDIDRILNKLEDLLKKSQSDGVVQQKKAEKELVDNLASIQEVLKPALNEKLGFDYMKKIVGGDYTYFSRIFAIVDEARENENVKHDPRFADCLKMSYEVEKLFEKHGVDLKKNRNKRQTLQQRRSRFNTIDKVKQKQAVSRSPSKFQDLLHSMENLLRKLVAQESESAEFQLIQLMDQYIDLTVDMLDSVDDDGDEEPDEDSKNKFCEMFGGGTPSRIALARNIFETASKIIEDSYFNYTEQCIDSCEQIEQKLDDMKVKREPVAIGRLDDLIQSFEASKLGKPKKLDFAEKSDAIQPGGEPKKLGFAEKSGAIQPGGDIDAGVRSNALDVRPVRKTLSTNATSADWPEMQAIMDLIRRYDFDSSGKIKRDKLVLVFSDVLPTMSKDEINKLFDGFNKDVDVDYAKLLQWLTPATCEEPMFET